MQDVGTTITILQQLRQLGIEISIDDFGTGYSSLNYLNQLPISSLKIDRTFVNQIHRDQAAVVISTAIIDLAKSLNLHIVAEGIETQNQLIFFRDRGCHAMQGFLYSPPVPAEEVQTLLSLDRRLSDPS
jgi:sensor c-di-GMP phosphodiesterase-like protein